MYLKAVKSCVRETVLNSQGVHSGGCSLYDTALAAVYSLRVFAHAVHTSDDVQGSTIPFLNSTSG